MTVFLRETTREERYRFSVQNIKSLPNAWLRTLKTLRSNLWQDVLILRLLCQLMRAFLLSLKGVLLFRLEDFLNLLLRYLRLPMRISFLSSSNGELSVGTRLLKAGGFHCRSSADARTIL